MAASNAYQAIVDITEVLDGRKITGFQIRVLILVLLVTATDGFELGASAFAGPDLMWDSHLSGPANAVMLAYKLAAGFLAPTILSYFADYFGRRPVIVVAEFGFGAFSLVVLTATLLNPRVVTQAWIEDITLIGIAFGGAPLAILVSLVNEFTPKRARAAMVILVLAGITFGGVLRVLIWTDLIFPAAPGAVFWIGGLAPLAIAPLLLFALPESVKYLALQPARRSELVALLKRIDNTLEIGAETAFLISGEINQKQFVLSALFRGILAKLTPLYWLANFTASMVFYFVIQWAPLFYMGSGLSAEQAKTATIVFQLGGALAGLLYMRVVNKLGYLPVPILFACAIPVVVGTGILDLASITYIVLVTIAWFCLLGVQFGSVATAANIYPTHVRAFGVGLNFAVARLGSGLAISSLSTTPFGFYLPLSNMFTLTAVPLVIGLIAALLIVPRYHAIVAQQRQSSRSDQLLA